MAPDQSTKEAESAEKRTIIYPPEEISKNAYIKSMDEYREMHRRSIEDVDAFWGEMAETLDWFKKRDNVHFSTPDKVVSL